MRRRHLFALTAAWLSLAAAIWPALAQAEPAGELRIGASAALSGPAGALGRRYHAGAQAWFDQLNKHHGGVQGAKLLVELRDDGYEPERAETNTRALLGDPRVLALFGYVGTPTSRVALPYVRRSGIAYLGAFTGASMLWDAAANPSVFNVRASYLDEGRVLARAMQASGARSVNVMVQADPFGRAGLEAMREALQASGLRLQATALVRRNSTEVDESVHTLVSQNPADAIFMVSTYETCAAFVRRARQAGFKGRFYTLSFAGLEPLRAALDGDLHDLTIAQVVPDPEDRALPVVAAYQKAMLEAGDRRFDSISLEGYIAARVLSEGLRRAKPPLSRASVRQGLESLGELDLGGFVLRYRPGQHKASSYVGLRGGTGR